MGEEEAEEEKEVTNTSHYARDNTIELIPEKLFLYNAYRRARALETHILQSFMFYVRSFLPEKAIHNISNIVPFFYGIISSVADYPDIERNTSSCKTMKYLCNKKEIDPSAVPHRTRFHLSVCSCINCLVDYSNRSPASGVWRYLSRRLPYTLLLEIRREFPKVYMVPAITPSSSEELSVPRTREEYFGFVRDYGVSKMSREYFPSIGRSNIYRYMTTCSSS